MSVHMLRQAEPLFMEPYRLCIGLRNRKAAKGEGRAIESQRETFNYLGITHFLCFVHKCAVSRTVCRILSCINRVLWRNSAQGTGCTSVFGQKWRTESNGLQKRYRFNLSIQTSYRPIRFGLALCLKVAAEITCETLLISA
jgi:hypothetical protein